MSDHCFEGKHCGCQKRFPQNSRYRYKERTDKMPPLHINTMFWYTISHDKCVQKQGQNERHGRHICRLGSF